VIGIYEAYDLYEKGRDYRMKKHRSGTIKRHAVALGVAMALALTGCGSSSDGSTSGGSGTVTPDRVQTDAGIVNLSEQVTRVELPETSMAGEHGTALSRSGFLLLNKLVETGDANANYLISPISLQTALGMTVTGADAGTDTEKELMAVLMPGVDGKPDTLNAEMATVAKRMQTAEGVSWNVANSIWVRNNIGVTLRDSYISDVTSAYAAELFSAPFDQSTLDALNAWVNKNTKERIPTILDKLDQNAAMVLINALAFDGAWDEPYQDSQISDGTFTNADGSTSKVTMLGSHEDQAILLDGGVGLIRPYKDNEYSFVAILPPEGMSANEYLSKVVSDGDSFSEAFLNASWSRGVNAAIPEFKVEYGVTMDDTLKALGVKEAYSDSAHFRAMLTDDSKEVKIGTVAHKTMIQVDRTGTAAAAATAVEMRTKGAVMTEPPYQVILDRPFVYGIVDNASGIPVFLGVQNTMN